MKLKSMCLILLQEEPARQMWLWLSSFFINLELLKTLQFKKQNHSGDGLHLSLACFSNTISEMLWIFIHFSVLTLKQKDPTVSGLNF